MIDEDNLKQLTPLMREANWLDDVQMPKERNLLFVLDSISFSYWGEPKWTVDGLDGAYALAYSLKRAVSEFVPMSDPKYLKDMSRRDLEYVLRGNTEIPMLDDRLNILRDLGKFLSKDPKLSDDAVEFAREISQLYYFNDVQSGIRFDKKAQLLANDLRLQNRDRLQGCADYKIPQVLRNYSAFVYDMELENKINDHHIFSPDDKEIIEIRQNTLKAISMLSKYSGLSRMDVNDSLWLLGQKKMKEPYHRCRTIYY